MIFIITGHIIGLLIPTFLGREIGIVADSDGGTVLVFILLTALLLFLLYQMYRSITAGEMYNRGIIYKDKQPKLFIWNQFSFAALSGLILRVIVTNL